MWLYNSSSGFSMWKCHIVLEYNILNKYEYVIQDFNEYLFC